MADSGVDLQAEPCAGQKLHFQPQQVEQEVDPAVPEAELVPEQVAMVVDWNAPTVGVERAELRKGGRRGAGPKGQGACERVGPARREAGLMGVQDAAD